MRTLSVEFRFLQEVNLLNQRTKRVGSPTIDEVKTLYEIAKSVENMDD